MSGFKTLSPIFLQSSTNIWILSVLPKSQDITEAINSEGK